MEINASPVVSTIADGGTGAELKSQASREIQETSQININTSRLERGRSMRPSYRRRYRKEPPIVVNVCLPEKNFFNKYVQYFIIGLGVLVSVLVLILRWKGVTLNWGLTFPCY
jgi:hypothetical protein